MALTRAKKESVVGDLEKKLSGAKMAVFTNFHGLDVKGMTELRRSLRKEGVEYVVAKKRLIAIALEKVGAPAVAGMDGEVGVAIASEDPTAAARITHNFAKTHAEQFQLLAGVFENRAIAKNDVIALATIPPREVLLGQLVGVLASPMRGLVMALSGVPKGLVYALAEIERSKK